MMAWSPETATTTYGDDLYRVVHPHRADHQGELQLEVGDIVTDCRHLGNDWTVGRSLATDTLGIFPSDCLEPLAQGGGDQQVSGEDTGQGSKHSLAEPEEDAIQDTPVDADPVGVIATPPGIMRNSHTPPRNATPIRGWGTPVSIRSNPSANRSTPPANRSTPPVSRSCVYGNQAPIHNYMDIDNVDEFDAQPPVGECSQNLRGSSLTQRGKPQQVVKPSRDTYPRQATNSERRKPPTVPVRYTPQRVTPPVIRPKPVVMQTFCRPETPQLNNPADYSDTDLDTECRYVSPAHTDVATMPQCRPQLSRNAAYSISIGSLDCTGSVADNSANERTQRQNIAQHSDNDGADDNETDLGVSMVCYHDYRTLQYPTQQDASSPLQTRARRKPVERNNTNTSASSGDQWHRYYHKDKRKKRTSLAIMPLVAAMFLGLTTFAFMYFYLDYWIWIALGVSGATCLLLCVAFTASRLCCCITALVLPSMCTPSGRIATLLLLSGLLLDGPVTNIYRNMAEMSRSMGCSAEQSFNQSQMLLQPFDGMMDQLNQTVMQLQYAASDVKAGLSILDDHMDDVSKHVDNGHVQLLGAGKTCSVMVRQAFNECASGINGAMGKCLTAMVALGKVYHDARDVLDQINPGRWASQRLLHLYKRQSEKKLPADNPEMPQDDEDVCEPLDTVAVCHGLNDTKTLCQPSRWAGEAIHGAINATKQAMHKLKLTLKFRASTRPFYDTKANTSKSVYQAKVNVRREFDERTRHFYFIISVLKKICPIAIVLLMYVAYAYIKRYVSLDSYDNIYVTKRFCDLDQNRSSVTGETLLPLKKYERSNLIDTSSSERNRPERELGRIGMCVLALHLLLTASFYMFDYIFYCVLGIIHTYGNPGVNVTGRVRLEEMIAGEGIIAELVEVFLKGFHPAALFGHTVDPYVCLPRPHQPSLVYLLLLAAFYLALFALTLTKAYMLRLRNRITGYFYRESEKARVVYLYNRLLRQRSHMLQTLQQRARQNHQSRLRRRTVSMCHQESCAPCKVFLYPTVKCLVCGALEDHSFRDCDTEQCRGVYCTECFADLLQQCPLCRPVGEGHYEEVDSEEIPTYWSTNGIYL